MIKQKKRQRRGGDGINVCMGQKPIDSDSDKLLCFCFSNNLYNHRNKIVHDFIARIHVRARTCFLCHHHSTKGNSKCIVFFLSQIEYAAFAFVLKSWKHMPHTHTHTHSFKWQQSMQFQLNLQQCHTHKVSTHTPMVHNCIPHWFLYCALLFYFILFIFFQCLSSPSYRCCILFLFTLCNVCTTAKCENPHIQLAHKEKNSMPLIIRNSSMQ